MLIIQGLETMKRIILCFLILPLLMAGGIYKWTDENGKVHFGDRPADINKAETVKIREQKTGSMVSGSTQKQWTRNTQYSNQTKRVNSLPATSAGSNSNCSHYKDLVKSYQDRWAKLRKRGYKQSDRNYYMDLIESYKAEVRKNC